MPVVAVSKNSGVALLARTGTTVTVVNRLDPAKAWQYLNGTSMATPHVTGATALMALNYPADNVTQRIARLRSGVDAVSAFQTRAITGGRLNVARPLDMDSDQLPDWWELEAVTNLAAMNGATDTDGDGASDPDEFAAGTDAASDGDFFQALADKETADISGRVIRWRSAEGRNYTLLRSGSLFEPFTPVASGLAATPPMNTYTDLAVGVQNPLFYRLRLD